jgi:hypothetical protein
LNLKLQTHLQEFLLVMRNRVSGQLVFEGIKASQLVNNTTSKKMTFWFLCLLTIMTKVPT